MPILKRFRNIDTMEFNIFKLKDKTEGNELVTMMEYIFHKGGSMLD